jgi:ABC-type nitrate/sulfonate/bicarbonate transport system substrate-binding protein
MYDRRSFLRYGAYGALGVAGGAVLAACGSSSSSSTATSAAAAGSSTTAAPVTLSDYKMSFQLSWLKDVEFAGSWIADSMGYYKANGLDVNLLAGGPNVAVEPVVTQGTALVGMDGIDTIAGAINQGSDIKIIAVLMQKNPFCVVSKLSTNIVTPTDLYGKKIGVAAGNLSAWNAFLALNNLDVSKIHVEPAQFDPTPVATGEFDGQVVFIDNEVIQLNEKGVKTATLLFEDFNYHLGTDAYVVEASSLADPTKRAAIVAFLKAEVKGWNYALANPTVATSLSVNDYGKNTGLSYTQQLAEMLAQTPLISTSFTKQYGLCYFNSTTTTPWLATLAASKITATAAMFDSSILAEVY